MLVVKRSRVSGKGAYATKDLPKGSVIPYYGIVKRRAEAGEDATYFAGAQYWRKGGSHFMRDYVIDGTPALLKNKLAPSLIAAAMINEAPTRKRLNCEINASPFTTRGDLTRGHRTGRPTVAFLYVLTRNVRRGEELLTYYGRSYARDYKVPF